MLSSSSEHMDCNSKRKKSAKLLGVCRVKYLAAPVRTEKFKIVFSAQGPVKPQQACATGSGAAQPLPAVGIAGELPAGQGSLI